MPFTLAALPLLVLVLLFGGGSYFLEVGDALIVVSMLGAAAIAGAIGATRGVTWDDIQAEAARKFASVFPIILILLSIGALIGAWVLSGTIPLLVWLGLELVSPGYIVLTAFLASALMSIFTGTSWGSAGTVGVALMGIAIAVDAPLPVVAGAVVSGAYFGDKMSPLSDSTNVAALSAGADLYSHIRHMTYTALPSFVFAGLVYLLAFNDTGAAAQSSATAAAMLRDIDYTFRLEWFALLPPLVVILAIARKWPPVLAISASAIVAATVGVAGQGFELEDALLALTTGFELRMLESLNLDGGNLSATFQALVSRGGIYSMVNTLVVVISAFLLAGAMEASGALKILVHTLLHGARSIFSLVASTMASSVVMLSLTSHGGVTCLIVGGLYQDGYRERKLAPVNLSRTLEDSVTLLDPLLPWTVSAVYMANTLGVATLEYLPWALFCLGGPFFTLLLAFLFRWSGFGLRKMPAAAGPADDVVL